MKTSNKILLSLFGLLLFSTLFAAFKGRSILGNMNVERGSGNITSEDRSVESFDEIKLRGQYKVYLTQGSESLRLETDDNLLDLIETYVDDGELHIKTKKGNKLKSSDNVKVYVGFETLKEITSSGSCTIEATGPIVVPRMEVSGSGYCKTTIPLETDYLGVKISGSGKFESTGKATRAEYQISGSGSIETIDLESEHVEVTISGSGRAKVNATEELEANISGSGDVAYLGNPRLSQRISGAGRIHSIGSGETQEVK